MYRPFFVALFSALLVVPAHARDASPRETPLVKVVRQVEPAVAVVYALKRNGQGSGSGAVVDPRGFVLSAKHVMGEQHVVVLKGRPPLQAKLIGVMPGFDLALLQLGGKAVNRPASPAYPLAGTPPAFVRLAIADDVMLGEPVLNIGSPGGRGVVVTRGIISSLGITGSSALAQATQSSNGWNQALQFDAASNPGNSGGPLINADGEQVGVVTSSIRDSEGIHFAVRPEHIRNSIAQMLNAEFRHRYVSGITIDPQSAKVRITDVQPSSPAAEAKLQADDIIVSIDGRALRDSIDWEFTRYDLRPDQEVQLSIMRNGKELPVSLKLQRREPQLAVEVPEKTAGLLSRVAAYDSRLSDPLVDDDRPAGAPTVVSQVTATPADAPGKDHYELIQEGYLQIEKAGVYRLGIESDDGSRLFVHDQLVVDNGGNHAEQIRSGWVDLAPGLHPLRVEFYEDEGDESLHLLIGTGNEELKEVPPTLLFH